MKNLKAKYLLSKGWKPYNYNDGLIQKNMYKKGILIETLKDAYNLQKKWDEQNEKPQT